MDQKRRQFIHFNRQLGQRSQTRAHESRRTFRTARHRSHSSMKKSDHEPQAAHSDPLVAIEISRGGESTTCPPRTTFQVLATCVFDCFAALPCCHSGQEPYRKSYQQDPYRVYQDEGYVEGYDRESASVKWSHLAKHWPGKSPEESQSLLKKNRINSQQI